MDLDVEDKITINKHYASKYQKKKEIEEFSILRDLYGDVDHGSSSESTDESEDEEGAWSAVTEAQFLRTLSLLKNKDPIIYNQNATFYTNEDTEEPVQLQGQSSKSMYLRDYERERLLTKGSKAELSDSEDEEMSHCHKGKSLTYQEEQDELRSQFKVAAEEMDEPVLTLRTKTFSEQAAEERDYSDWLKKNEGNKELSGLTSFWGNPQLDKGEQFLRDYILNQGHRDNIKLSVPTYEEVVGVASDSEQEVAVASDSEDEEALEEQEDFERQFNFRFEEPDSDLIKSFPRTIASSVRAEKHSRQLSRQQRQQKKKEEREREQEELRRLKNLKKRHVENQLKQLSEVTGNSMGDLENIAGQLEEDFDPATYDQSMEAVFGNEYYEEQEDEEEKPDVGEDDGWWEEELYCEDPGFNMDADFEESAPVKSKRSKTKTKSTEPVVKEGTFKYRTVLSNDFGLSTDEILGCENKELNSWVSLAKMVQYRSEEEEKKDKSVYRKKGRDWSKKKRCLASVYTETDQVTKSEEEAVEKSKKKSKTKTKKQKTKSSKLSETRLKSYGL